MKNNFEQKILSLKLLDYLKQDSFELFEFKKFYEDFEKNIIYESQQVIDQSLGPSMILGPDSFNDSSRNLAKDEMEPLDFIEAVKHYLNKVKVISSL